MSASGAALAAMYQDALLTHYRAPHNRRDIAGPTAGGSRRNPLCGDEIRVQVQLDQDVIADVAFGGRGCSIATASASMLTGVVRGLTRRDALGVANAVDAMLRGDSADIPIELQALRGVAPFPARHACAMMPWLALRDALAKVSAGSAIGASPEEDPARE